LEGHQGRVTLAGFSADGRQLITAGADGCLRFWDPEGAPLGRVDGVAGTLALAPDARTLAAAGPDNQVRLWDVAAARVAGVCERQAGLRGVAGLAFSPDGRVLAAAAAAGPFGRDGDPAVGLWDAATGAALGTLTGPPGTGRAGVAFMPDGQRLATADGDALRMWDPDGGVTSWTVDNFTGRGGSVAVAPGGDLLAVADHGHNGVRLCRPSRDSGSGEVVARLEFADRDAGVCALAFAPDGSLLAAGGAGGAVRIWEVATLRERACFRGHRGPVETLAFSPDGGLLASGSRDTTVLVWSLRGGTARLSGASRTPGTGPRGRTGGW
jgi:WD40 repeat protein